MERIEYATSFIIIITIIIIGMYHSSPSRTVPFLGTFHNNDYDPTHEVHFHDQSTQTTTNHDE